MSAAGEKVAPQCPITRRPYFMHIEHPALGNVPTYGGPFNSYTVPEPDDDGNFHSEHYCHDRGDWIEGGNPEGLVLVTEREHNALLTQRDELEAEVKRLDPDPVVCGCREAMCPHTPIAQLPRQMLVDHFRERIKTEKTERDALEAERDQLLAVKSNIELTEEHLRRERDALEAREKVLREALQAARPLVQLVWERNPQQLVHREILAQVDAALATGAAK